MPKILFNPTNEKMESVWNGDLTVLNPGDKLRMDDARANAILSNLYPRGIRELEFGDEGDGELKKAEDGRQANHDFKRKHVMRFNAQNDQQIQTKRPFITPDPITKDYARELGMKLFEPYSSTDDASKEFQELKGKLDSQAAELQQKDTALEQMKTDMAEMRKMMQKIVATGPAPSAEARDAEFAEIRKTVRGLNRNHFSNWVQKNYDMIMTYPESVQAEIRDKYEKMYSVPFPANSLEASAIAA